jgi:hypothetical protein
MNLSGLSYIKRNLLCSWQDHFGLVCKKGNRKMENISAAPILPPLSP